MKKERAYPWLLLVLGAILLFAGNQDLLVTDPVESNYAETALEMLRSGDWFSPMIYGHYWYDKPIFYYWELLLSFKLFGVTSFAARLGSALFGLLGIELSYFFVKRLYSAKRAMAASLLLLTSAEYFYIGKAIITDMTLFVFLEMTLMAFYLGYTQKKSSWYYAAYTAAAIGTLVKGPIGLGLPGLIILFFLWWRRDIKALAHMKLVSGGLLYLILTGLWYGPMTVLHGHDFLLNFFGVHNFLRATVSEHPRQNVWYYYFFVFLLGWAPWSFTLPLSGSRREWTLKIRNFCRHAAYQKKLPEVDVRTAFFASWAFVTVFIFELVQTKYMTYTFPYMLPFAVFFSSFLVQHERLVKGLAGGALTVYLILTYMVAIPQCRKASAYDAAQIVRTMIRNDTTVVTYGGRYPVSLTYYSGYVTKRLKWKDEIPELLPGALDWIAKNMMPFASIESLSEDKDILAVVRSGDLQDFETDIDGIWECVHDDGMWMVLRKVVR